MRGAIRSSKPARNSKVAARAGEAGPGAPTVLAGLILLSAGAVWFFYLQGWLLYFGDAEAHLNIARRVADSRTPGYDQIGTVWLPLPHWLLLPLVRVDWLWQTGLAGSIAGSLCFVAGGGFLFGAARRLFGPVAGATAAALFALNPNVLYLQATPMTEPVFACTLLALLYCSVRFQESQSLVWVAGAGLAACGATLTRYEGWFLLPFAAAYFWLAARSSRTATAACFCVLAGLGPLYWLGHNWWLTGDPLEFYRGPYSARAIQGSKPYPGRGDWLTAWLYYRTAVELCAGLGLAVSGIAGLVAALVKRAFWPVLLLALPGIFIVWSVHSSGTPIFVPVLWPNSYYNTRYAVTALPVLALGVSALVGATPARARAWVAAVMVAACITPWLLHPKPGAWITWEESRVNSEARRQWTGEAAGFLNEQKVRGPGIVTSFGDLTGIFRTAGIPLRETFTGDNGLPWLAATRRPRLLLWQEWAVAIDGDAVDRALKQADGLYRLQRSIVVKGAPALQIYRRRSGQSMAVPAVGGKHGTP